MNTPLWNIPIVRVANEEDVGIFVLNSSEYTIVGYQLKPGR